MKLVTISYPEDESKKYDQFRYPAGEAQVRLRRETLAELKDATHVRVVARIRDGEVTPLALLTDALDRATDADKTLILPYLPYGRADRAFVAGDCGGLYAFGNMVNLLCYERVVTLDAHSETAANCVQNLVDVSPEPFVKQALARLTADGYFNPKVLFADKGAAERYWDSEGWGR